MRRPFGSAVFVGPTRDSEEFQTNPNCEVHLSRQPLLRTHRSDPLAGVCLHERPAALSLRSPSTMGLSFSGRLVQDSLTDVASTVFL